MGEKRCLFYRDAEKTLCGRPNNDWITARLSFSVEDFCPECAESDLLALVRYHKAYVKHQQTKNHHGSWESAVDEQKYQAAQAALSDRVKRMLEEGGDGNADAVS